MKQSQNQPYNNCNLKTINVENQTIKTIETLEAQLKANTKAERKQYLKFQRHYPKAATATTYEAFNAAIAKFDSNMTPFSMEGELSNEMRSHMLRLVLEREGTRQAFVRQGADNLTRKIAGFKVKLHKK